jgi:hypothetical protein
VPRACHQDGSQGLPWTSCGLPVGFLCPLRASTPDPLGPRECRAYHGIPVSPMGLKAVPAARGTRARVVLVPKGASFKLLRSATHPSTSSFLSVAVAQPPSTEIRLLSRNWIKIAAANAGSQRDAFSQLGNKSCCG